MPARDDYEIYEIPDFTLECGVTLRPARIAYKPAPIDRPSCWNIENPC